MRFTVAKEKKNYGKRSSDICPECNRSLINANGSYCSCWESKLPKNSKSSIKAHSTDVIEIYSQSLEAWTKKKEVSKQAWINRLKECGLDHHEIELMLLRFYEENDFKQIVRKCGWVSVDAAAYAYKKAIGKLRRKGFSFG
jgi:DNA-directed RNA polymerase specialized sigma subunit